MDPQQIQAVHSLIDDLQQTVADATDAVIHAQDIEYTVPDLDPDSQDYTTASWDGSDAVAAYPDPSSDDTDLDAFRRNFLLAPSVDSDQADVKSAYKLPFRDSHEGAVNVNALQAAQQAVNGARGGVDGVAEDRLRDAYDTATTMRVAAGDLEDADQAPEFSANVAASRSFHAHVEASDAGDASKDGLRGIVWASGQHDLWVNGDPTPVYVPDETIPETYQRVKDRVQAGDPPSIGFDHPDDESVAAQTALGEIGVAREFSQETLDDGREAVVMRDSEFTNPKAVEAAAAGSFDGFGFSIVGNIALQEDDGEPVQREDGALVVEATEIQRIDLVPDQAVDGATNGNLPELADAAAASGRLAASSPRQQADGLVRTLRAAAGSIDAEPSADVSGMTENDDIPTDPEDLDAAKAALSQASETVEAKDEQIEELQAQVASLSDEAEHFREIAASQGVDPDADEFTPQDVVDAFSEDLRAEIADLEAALPKYETEDQEDRVDDLAGKPLSELEAMAGERWRAFGRSKAKRDELSAAVAADETVGTVESEATSDEETDRAARSVMTAREIHAANARGQDPTDFIEAEHGVSPGEYSSEHELQAAISGGDS